MINDLPTTPATVGVGSLVVAKKPGLLVKLFRWLFGDDGATVVVPASAKETTGPTEEDIVKARAWAFEKQMAEFIENYTTKDEAVAIAAAGNYRLTHGFDRDSPIVEAHTRGKISAAHKYVDKLEILK